MTCNYTYICLSKITSALLDMQKIFIALLLFTSLHQVSFGQDTLPKISVTQLGRKAVLSWVNPYSNVTNINIQRSGDSLKGFTTIGSVISVDTKTNGFMDTKEFLPSDQYYRLFVSFEGGSYIFTQSHRPSPDTSSALVEIQFDDNPQVKTWFTPSRYIFTGKDNNVIIALPDAARKKYSVQFFENEGTFLFEIKHITLPFLTVDKVNFRHSGLFNFQLYDNQRMVEKHKFYIPKDGKSMPALDVNGYELK